MSEPQQQQKSDWEDREIGALWKKTSKNNTEYYGGKVDDKPVIIFVNKNKKEGSNQPHLIVYKDTRPPKPTTQEAQAQPQQQQQPEKQAENVEEDVFM